MPKVYIVHKPADDFQYDKAEVFGEIKILTQGRVALSPADDSHNLEFLRNEFEASFGEDDFILLSGTKLLNAMAVIEAAKRVKVLKVLTFVVAKGEYVLHSIPGLKN